MTYKSARKTRVNPNLLPPLTHLVVPPASTIVMSSAFTMASQDLPLVPALLEPVALPNDELRAEPVFAPPALARRSLS